MIAGLLTIVLGGAPGQWDATARWLSDMDQPELAVEAVLAQDEDSLEARSRVAMWLVDAIATMDPGEPETRRLRIELQGRLPSLDAIDLRRAQVALLGAQRDAAVIGGHDAALLRGALRSARVLLLELDEDMHEAQRSSQRRWIQTLRRRVRLLAGLLLVDLGSASEARTLLQSALLDGDGGVPDPVPPALLENPDGAWAAAALAAVALDRGDVDEAQHLVGALVQTNWPLPDTSLLIRTVEAMPPSVSQEALTEWARRLSDASLLDLATRRASAQGTVELVLERGLRDSLVELLAASDTPLPDHHMEIAALAAAGRARRGAMTWEAATALLQNAAATGGPDISLALGEAMLNLGRAGTAADLMLELPPGPHSARADAIALAALSRRVDDGSVSPVVLEALLRRMVARGRGAPLWHEASLRLASLGSTRIEEAFDLLNGIPRSHELHGAAAALGEQLAWARRDEGAAGAMRVVHAAAVVMEVDQDEAVAAAHRLLVALPDARLVGIEAAVLSQRAIDVLAEHVGEAAAAGARARLALDMGDIEAARARLLDAWASGHRSEALLETARGLLATDALLGAHATEVAARLLGGSPLSLDPGEVRGEDRIILRHWARHLVRADAITLDMLEHAASMDALDQGGLMALGRRASEGGRWHLATDAWRRAAAMGGERAQLCLLEQAGAMAHLDSTAAMDLAAQLAVLYPDTEVGKRARALRRRLEVHGP